VRKDLLDRCDVLILLNNAAALEMKRELRADLPLVLWTQHADDQPPVAALADPAERSAYAGFAFVSAWQEGGYRRRFGLMPERTTILRNAMAPAFAALPPRARLAADRPPLFAYTSAPARGLQVLLDAWSHIRDGLPKARLQVFSSMAVYQREGVADKYRALYERCSTLPGVEYVGSLAQPDLAQALLRVDALTYPSIFTETSCISAIEALAAGCLVLSTDLGALRETTAGFGRLITLPRTRENLPEAFAAMVVGSWRAVAGDLAAHEARVAAQREFMGRTAVWPVRALEWQAFLMRVAAGRA
jgi:glycosyltransferase involved in cell wall biosynthesis